MSIFFTRDNELGKEYLGATGGFRKWLEGSKLVSYPDFVSGEVSTDHHGLETHANDIP